MYCFKNCVFYQDCSRADVYVVRTRHI